MIDKSKEEPKYLTNLAGDALDELGRRININCTTKAEVMNDGKVAYPDRIDTIFTYQSPNADDIVAYQKIREKAKEMARIIDDYTPKCADQSAAIRKLRECVMTANAAIALRGVS